MLPLVIQYIFYTNFRQNAIGFPKGYELFTTSPAAVRHPRNRPRTDESPPRREAYNKEDNWPSLHAMRGPGPPWKF